MDLALAPFIDGRSHRSTDPSPNIFEDIDGMLDWLTKRPHGRRLTEDTNYEPCADGVSYTTSSDDDYTAMVDLGPPLWHGLSLPGDQVLLVATSPDEAYKMLRGFFEGMSVVEQAWEMKVTGFVDYVAVNVEVHMFACTTSVNQVVVAFRHISKLDIVRFQQLISTTADYLQQHVPVDMLSGASPTPPSYFEEDSFIDELEMDWSLCVAAALEEVASGDIASKEVALQSLASWAADRPEARPAISDALAARASIVQALLREQTPLAQLYPFAITLKFAAPNLLPDGYNALLVPAAAQEQRMRWPAAIAEVKEA